MLGLGLGWGLKVDQHQQDTACAGRACRACLPGVPTSQGLCSALLATLAGRQHSSRPIQTHDDTDASCCDAACCLPRRGQAEGQSVRRQTVIQSVGLCAVPLP